MDRAFEDLVSTQFLLPESKSLDTDLRKRSTLLAIPDKSLMEDETGTDGDKSPDPRHFSSHFAWVPFGTDRKLKEAE